MRRSAIACSIAAATLGALFSPAAAVAARAVLPASQASTHFVVHYAPPPDGAGITDATAATVLARAEQAWSVIVDGWGWKPQSDGVDGGDDRVDVYMLALPPGLVVAHTISDTATPTSSAYIELDFARGLSLRIIAHELLHVGQAAIARPSERWLKEATAEWAGRAIAGTTVGIGTDPAVSLDCLAADLDVGCGVGHGRWPYFSFLATRFGPGNIRAIFERWPAVAAAPQPGLQAIDGALGAVGSSLSATFGDFATSLAAGPHPSAAVIGTAGTRTLPPLSVAVDHLAARYVSYRAVGALPCRPATLHIAVTAPPGAPAPPTFRSQTGEVVTLQGSRPLVADIPWSTCGVEGRLVLPNANWTADAVAFTVNASVAAAATTAAPPPAPRPVPRRARGPVAPRLQILSTSRAPTRSGRVTVRLRCRTLRAGGCRGTAALSARLPRGRTSTLLVRSWTARTSAPITLRLQLNRRARRITRTALRLRLDVFARDAARSASGRRSLAARPAARRRAARG